jgi:hypothetical protein
MAGSRAVVFLEVLRLGQPRAGGKKKFALGWRGGLAWWLRQRKEILAQLNLYCIEFDMGGERP